ncbi:hypothetical protein CKAN_01188200 [Cinnamomum micranthum f. kanehirae]|uniref:Uncharacterized protein n=1 Tax=Cinnamomum micranthum f. kanehirae TaxID=337451 RepID=A0A3S4NY22_9MAGN|nr:hypothetical protein CKAN_01188200 [Cinnamomum micranthum f. kanehirae]
MDYCKKNHPPSIAPNRPSAIPKPFSPDFYQRASLGKANREEINENDEHFHQRISPSSQNPKKGAKNFMSPTVSAASKAALPRKKVLMERNEAFGSDFSESQMGKSPNFSEGETSPDLLGLHSQITPPSMKVSEYGYSSDSVSAYLPYDPLTNYLSPRPQFLRYKPNRRLDMFLHRKNKLRNGEEGVVLEGGGSTQSPTSFEGEALKSSSTSSSQDGTEELQDGTCSGADRLDSKPSHNEETEESEGGDDDNDVDDEEKGERFWHSSLVLKSLLLLGILFFTTLYISPANRPAIPTSLQLLQGFREGYSEHHKPLFQFTENMRPDVDQISETIEPVADTDADNEIHGDLLFGTVDLEGRESYDGVPSMVEEMVVESEETDNDLCEAGESEVPALSSFMEQEKANEQSLMEVIETNNDEGFGEVEVGDYGMAETREAKEILELQGKETVEVYDSLQVPETQFSEDSVAHEDTYSTFEKELVEISGTVIDEGTRKLEMGEDEIVKLMEMTDPISESQEQGREVPDNSESLHGSQAQLVLDSFVPDIASASETELNSGKEDISLLESMKNKLNKRAAVGRLTLVSMIAASMALGFLCLKRRKTSANDSSSHTCQQLPSKPTVLEKGSLSFPEKEQVLEHCSLSFPEKNQAFEKGSLSFPEKEQVLEKGDSYANPLSLALSNDNWYESCRTNPPNVELLGEYAVGETSFSEQSTDQKLRAEVEERKVSKSQVSKRSTRRSLPSSSQTYPTASEFSMAESPSNGRSASTQEKLMAKDQGSSDREEEMNSNAVIRNRRGEIITPVRRSSRIRHRVMSP